MEEKVQIKDIALKISRFKRDRCAVPEITNAIYVPLQGAGTVYHNIGNLPDKGSYIEVELDSQIVNAIYLASFFNSEVGLKTRECISGCVSGRAINLREFGSCKVVLPDLRVQNDMINVNNMIDKKRLLLNKMQNDVWNTAKGIDWKLVNEELGESNSNTHFVKWIDALPFPLASILWNYHATEQNEKKVEHLFYFFEGLSEFLCIIILSTYYQDKDFYEREKLNWINDLEDNKEWYRRASFGQWNMYLSKLTKVARRLLNSNEKRYMQDVLGNPPHEFYNIFNKGVHSVLISVSDLRNRWKGHTGIVGEEESVSRLKTLEHYLIDLRISLGSAFDNAELIMPLAGKKTKGVLTNQVFSLMGSRTPFPEKNITVNELLDTAKLYLHFDDQDKSIELLPLLMFQIKSGAFYFYTSVETIDTENAKVRWISYHYEKESIIETDLRLRPNLLEPFEEN